METNGVNNVNPELPGVERYFEHLKETFAKGLSTAESGLSEREKELLSAFKKDAMSAMEDIIEQLNEIMKSLQKDLRFHFFVGGTDLAYVEVINPRTNETITTVPPEQLIEALLRIHNALGLILDRYL